MIRHAFITVTDASFFPGTLATVASIRRWAPLADVIVVQNDKNPLTAAQAECFRDRERVRLLPSACFERDGRFINAWELKAYAACDLSGEYEVVIGIDSDCLLCSNVDAEIDRCYERGSFMGGEDGDGADYDASYGVYGFPTPARNPRYMSTSLYFCRTTPENRQILDRWARCCNSAVFNCTGAHPGHGDQGVLNAVIFGQQRTDSVELLENHLWSQHWVYWDSLIDYQDGRFVNLSAGARPQRSFHCGGVEKFWERAHRERVLAARPPNAYPYAYFLAMFWFGGGWPTRIDPRRCIPSANHHLIEDLIGFLPKIVAVHPPARALWNELPERLVDRLSQPRH
jgi:hypothetical protein